MTPSTSPCSTDCRRASPAVIDTPAGPAGWQDARRELVRIVDPLGRAVAWLAPSQGRCVGFAVRGSAERGTPWVELLAPAGAAVDCAPSSVSTPAARWEPVERDPTAALLRGYTAERELRFRASLTDEQLLLEVRATTCTEQAVRLPVRLIVHLLRGPAGVEVLPACGVAEVRRVDDTVLELIRPKDAPDVRLAPHGALCLSVRLRARPAQFR
jgi:hypothetical protein